VGCRRETDESSGKKWPREFMALWFHVDNQLKALSDTKPETGLNFELRDRLRKQF